MVSDDMISTVLNESTNIKNFISFKEILLGKVINLKGRRKIFAESMSKT